MADHPVRLIVHKALNPFNGMLPRTGPIHRQSSAHEAKETHEQGKNQDFHGKGVVDRSARVLGVNADDSQNGIGGTGEPVIEEGCDPEFFRHDGME